MLVATNMSWSICQSDSCASEPGKTKKVLVWEAQVIVCTKTTWRLQAIQQVHDKEHEDSFGVPKLERILTFSDLDTEFFFTGAALSLPPEALQS